MSDKERPLDPPEKICPKYIQSEEEWKENNLADVMAEFIENRIDFIIELILNNNNFLTDVSEAFEFQQYLHQKFVDDYSSQADRIHDEMKDAKEDI